MAFSVGVEIMAPPNQPAQPQSSVTVFATSPLMIATMAQALSSHSLRFTGQRLQAHAQHLQALAQCESLQDLFAQQMAFISETARQFSDVMARAMQAQPPAEAMPAQSPAASTEEAPEAAAAMRPRPAAPRRAADGEATQSH